MINPTLNVDQTGPVLLKRVNVASDVMAGWQQCLGKNHVAVMGAVNFFSWFDEYQVGTAEFGHGDRHHDRFSECGLGPMKMCWADVMLLDHTRCTYRCDHFERQWRSVTSGGPGALLVWGPPPFAPPPLS